MRKSSARFNFYQNGAKLTLTDILGACEKLAESR